MFALDTPYAAVSSLIGAVIHELGHVAVFAILGKRASLPRARFFGLKITEGSVLSYKEEIAVALAGPASNIMLCIISLPLLIVDKSAYTVFMTVNLAEAFSNLLPVKGYDGYKAVKAAAGRCNFALISNIIDAFSFFFITLMCFFSLYLIARFGEGYWIFLIFFLSLLSEARESRFLGNN